MSRPAEAISSICNIYLARGNINISPYLYLSINPFWIGARVGASTVNKEKVGSWVGAWVGARVGAWIGARVGASSVNKEKVGLAGARECN